MVLKQIRKYFIKFTSKNATDWAAQSFKKNAWEKLKPPPVLGSVLQIALQNCDLHTKPYTILLGAFREKNV